MAVPVFFNEQDGVHQPGTGTDLRGCHRSGTEFRDPHLSCPTRALPAQQRGPRVAPSGGWRHPRVCAPPWQRADAPDRTRRRLAGGPARPVPGCRAVPIRLALMWHPGPLQRPTLSGWAIHADATDVDPDQGGRPDAPRRRRGRLSWIGSAGGLRRYWDRSNTI